MEQKELTLTEEQTGILAYLMMYGTIEKAAEKMGVTDSYITNHLTDPHFANICFEVATTAHADARTKGYDSFNEYIKAGMKAEAEAQTVSDLSKSLRKNTSDNAVGPSVRKALFRRDYLQPVCSHGYVVCDGFIYDRRSLEKGTIIGWKPISDEYYLKGRDYRLYNPMRDNPGLHRIFAAVEPSEESIGGFCSKYGALWEPWDLFSTGREVDVCHNYAVPHGYEITAYLDELHQIKQTIILYDILASEDFASIKSFCEEPNLFGYKDNLERLADNCRKIPVGYLFAHLNELLCFHVSYALQRNEVVPELIIGKYASEGHFSKEIYDASREPHELNEPYPEWTRFAKSNYFLSQPNGMELVYRPRNLAGVLWLMLAYEITGVKTYKQCPACGSWFEVSELNDNRISRVYCDGNCRARAYRKRKSENTFGVYGAE